MIQGNEIQQAQYLAQAIRAYQGVPAIECLPPILPAKEVIKRLTSYPVITEEDLAAPPEIRKRLIISGLSGSFYQPLKEHVDIESLISITIRQGYMGRNPPSPACRAKKNELYLEQMGMVGEPAKGPHNMTMLGSTIIGISGVGKSSAVESVLKMYPQTVRHTVYNGESFLLDQVVWLKIDCPDDGSLKALCAQFFSAMDMGLGTHYTEEYVKPRQSEQIYLTGMKRCAYQHQLGILVVDEIQHLNVARSGGAERMLNFFVTLVNTIGVPVLLVGTPAAEQFIPKNFRQARRGNGQGGIRWERMGKESPQWKAFTMSMWKYQWIQRSVGMTDEMNDALYSCCQGIAVLAVALFEQVQLEAIRSETETFATTDFSKILREKFFFMTRMIQALRNNDKKAIARYEDISFKILAETVQQESQEPTRSGRTKINSIKDLVVLQLEEMGILPEEARDYVEEAATAMGGTLKKESLLKAAFKLYLDHENQKNQEPTKETEEDEET